MNTEITFRYRLAKRILFLTLGLFVLLLVLRAAGGFDQDESDWLLSVLTPLSTLYGSVVLKYMLKYKNEVNLTAPEPGTLPQYKSVTTSFFYIHLALLYGGILFGAFNLITFEFLKFYIATLETVFAVYIGQVVADLFKTE